MALQALGRGDLIYLGWRAVEGVGWLIDRFG